MSTIGLAITNPGAEDGTTGWASTQGGLETRADDPLPHDGSAYFYGGADQSETVAHQDVSLPEMAANAVSDGEATLSLQWWQNSFSGSDDAEMRYQFIDGDGQLIDSEVALGLDSPSTWELREFDFAVPSQARKVRLAMRMVRGSGDNNDGYIDQISAAIDIPEDYLLEGAFEAGFEDVSGRDPLPTALIERTPARRLANHNVIVYRYPPYRVTKRVPIALDDYPLTLPGKMIWHKDDKSALFAMGRWAQIEGRRFTDNPVEVELTLRISDHPESFEEPT